MYFRILRDEASGAVSYLLADLDAQECVLIDPRVPDVPLLAALMAERGLRLRWTLRTHQHDADPLQTLQAFGALGAPVVQGDAAEGAVNPGDGDALCFGSECVQVWRTPGHTAGCLSFLWRDRMFCGGLLAIDACAQQPLPAEPEALWDSVVQRLFALPAETLLFAGHVRQGRVVSTVLEERAGHPYFAARTRDEFLAAVAGLPRTARRSPERRRPTVRGEVVS
ncbi:glyoxylase-like metal-dependent hydrolase (beta-lactamase superfamily II) [Tibeticola sediminis]|uniref:Glyoxylase-like metal-dependent hydrolase (Beta-lactamase superfamily II) n=1 Tax=Tibeticola sediminis TaxID=1917811 RepID=A0A3N4UQA5_9BURK|nr:hypothetical protein [Tibeticola sediminis]RPE62864.1 glyoxylase-like metal-dependent hydrolase (beta-lactamase superfamily II) [Tibeticola sediminis]